MHTSGVVEANETARPDEADATRVTGESARVASAGASKVMAWCPAVTVSALTPADRKSEFGADAKSGAAAGNVGFAGALAANVVVVGMADYFELWSPDSWAQQNEQIQDAQANAARFADLRLTSA